MTTVKTLISDALSSILIKPPTAITPTGDAVNVTQTSGIAGPACGDPNPYHHCHTAEEREAAIVAKGAFDWMKAVNYS